MTISIYILGGSFKKQQMKARMVPATIAEDARGQRNFVATYSSPTDDILFSIRYAALNEGNNTITSSCFVKSITFHFNDIALTKYVLLKFATYKWHTQHTDCIF